MNTKNDVNTTVGALLKGMDSFITTKTVVGDPQQVGDTIILPLIDASFGVGAGAFCDDKKNNGVTEFFKSQNFRYEDLQDKDAYKEYLFRIWSVQYSV